MGMYLFLLTLLAGDGVAALPQGKVVDLSHDYSSDTIYWPTAEGFQLTVDFKGTTEKGYHYEANSFKSAEHGGTHLDAPAHFAEGGWTTDQIPLEHLMGPAVVLDVSVKAAADPDYQVSVNDFRIWEARNGRLQDGVIVLLRTGYAKYWPDREKYLGTAERGAEAVAKLHFPGLHPDAAQWLATERRIHAIGLDTASIDRGQSTLFESHRNLFKANIPAFENLTNLDQLPERGALIIALPMKIKGGSGGPLRVLAIVP